MLPPVYPWIPSKNVSPFGPAVWPALGNIYTNVLFYCIDYYNDAGPTPQFQSGNIVGDTS